ncbi:hypothetical protein EDD16DRAFT_1597439, partial [Pisolithus croceorrhizus]
KPQREITASMGLLPRRSTPLSAPGASASTSASVRQVRDRGKPYAAIRRTPRPVKQPTGPKQNMSRERNADLRTAYAEGMELRRWFRDGELLWCALNPPIPASRATRTPLQEAKIKSEAVAKPNSHDETSEKNTGADVVMADATRPIDGSNDSTDNDEDKRVPWTVVQTLWYKIKLLGIPYSYNIRADQVLPYQAHAPSDELIQAIHRVPLEQMNTNTDTFKPSDTTRFAEARHHSHLQSRLPRIWLGIGQTDDWEYKFSIPPSPDVAPSPFPAFKSDNMSLHAVMNASMAYNASLSESISAAGPSSGSTSITDGLWWGAERVWTDELVRLKLSQHITPCGPSRRAIEYARTLDGSSDDCEEIVGAAGRGLFMLLEGLYVVDVPKVNGSTGKECRATGTLYELVDEDWEGDAGEGSGNGKDSGKGKGKATEQSGGTEAPVTSTNGVTTGSISIEAPSGPQLANPNPAVPVERTTSDIVSHSDSITVLGQRTASKGFRFRPILTPGYEAVISLNLIAGRYYPRLLQHPLLQVVLKRRLIPEVNVVEASQLWALEGLAPGFNNTMDPVRWRPTRVGMIREADIRSASRPGRALAHGGVVSSTPTTTRYVTNDAGVIPAIEVLETNVSSMEVDSQGTRGD